VPSVVNSGAKFEVTNSIRSRDMEIWGHVTPSQPSLTYFFSFFSLVSPVIYLRAKYEVSSLNRSRDMDGFKNSKSRSRDTIKTRFDLIFDFHRWCLRWSIWVPNLKLLTQSVREIWRYGVT